MKGDPTQCAFSRACQRMWESSIVVFFSTVAYVDLLSDEGTRRVERFIISKGAQDFIRAFDDGEHVNPKGFVLSAPRPSQTVDRQTQAQSDHKERILKGTISGERGPQDPPRAYTWTNRRASFYRHGAGMVHFSAKTEGENA